MAFTVPSGETVTLSSDRHVGDGEVRIDGTLVVDGSPTISYPPTSTPYQAIPHDLYMNGSIEFANPGDKLTIDQTAENCAVKTHFGTDARMGDGTGVIHYDGQMDVFSSDTPYSDSGGPGKWLFEPAPSGTVVVNGLAMTGPAKVPGHPGSNLGGLFWDTPCNFEWYNCYLRGIPNNLQYGVQADQGYQIVENCRFEQCKSRGIAIPGGGLTARNCCWVYGGELTGILWHQRNEVSYGGQCITANVAGASNVINRSATIENCDFVRDGTHGQAAVGAGSTMEGHDANFDVEIINSRSDFPNHDNPKINYIGSYESASPEAFPPPTDNPIPSEGGSGSDGPTPTCEGLSNTLVITGQGTATKYQFTVGEGLGAPDPLEVHDNVDGSTATGWVTTTEHVDEFCFSGKVQSFEYLQGGPVDLVLNGTSHTADSIIGEPTTGPCDGVDCPEGQMCVDGNCVQCVTADDCSGSRVCADNICVDCLTDSDCLEGVCVNDTCVDCATDGDCPSGQMCDGNTCVPEVDTEGGGDVLLGLIGLGGLAYYIKKRSE